MFLIINVNGYLIISLLYFHRTLALAKHLLNQSIYRVYNEIILTRNYLSKSHFVFAKTSVISTLNLCLLACLNQWNQQLDIVVSREAVFQQGEYWRLFTTSFVHGDLNHLLANTFMLAILLFYYVKKRTFNSTRYGKKNTKKRSLLNLNHSLLTIQNSI